MTDKELKVTIITDTGRGGIEMIQSLGGLESSKRTLDPVSIAPDLKGSLGVAWRVDFDELRRRNGSPPDAGVAGWVVEARWAHPIWHSYTIAVIHLRNIPGMPPPHINLAGATHEFFLFALDPDKPREPAILGRERAAIMTPANFGAQFISASDEDAITFVRAAIQDVIDGKLSPDTDHLSAWRERFGDSMIKPEFR